MISKALENFFDLNLNDYDNIGVDLPINKVLLIAFIAFGVVTVMFSVYRGSIRLMIIQLQRHGAVSTETAKALGEIGLHNSRILKFLLSRDNLLTKTVGRVGESEYTYEEYVKLAKEKELKEEKIDFDSAQFYIRESMADRAIHIKEKYEVSKVRVIAFCVFLVIMYICVASVMPELLNMLNNLIKNAKM